ncbi:MAG: hypothetical protein Q7T86_07275 [Hyphomicrobiaceae bacterium]|nr:hypothetical protein [Hyphomicrobiaceae bacterium]
MSSGLNFSEQLAKQLGYLERSAKAYDEGHADEGIRIAQALRVIFHNIDRSTGLIEHLQSPTVTVRSTVSGATRSAGHVRRARIDDRFTFFARRDDRLDGCGRKRPLDRRSNHDRFIPWAAWWEERFAIINGFDYTRKGLVLWASNKDGGAHVDEKFPAAYQAIKASAALGRFSHGNELIPVEDAHLVFLRSMAFEVLNSPELRRLAGG